VGQEKAQSYLSVLTRAWARPWPHLPLQDGQGPGVPDTLPRQRSVNSQAPGQGPADAGGICPGRDSDTVRS
jgi:hypothetical protein